MASSWVTLGKSRMPIGVRCHGVVVHGSDLARVGVAEMTKDGLFSANAAHQRPLILAYDGCQLLDVTGPAAVFGARQRRRQAASRIYDLQIVLAAAAAPVTSQLRRAHSARQIGGQPDTCWSRAARAA